jgi:deoxyribodipyrimidine photolyase-related protein
LIARCDTIYLVEEYLFFKQYNFHKQKIAFHRMSMKFYESYLQSKNIQVVKMDATNDLAEIRK